MNTEFNMQTLLDLVQQLQFLRAQWLYAFIPLVLFIVLMLLRRRRSRGWQALCDPQLLPHVLSGGSSRASRLPLLLVFIASSLGIIAAAGPVYEKLPQPVFREQSALVVLLDLSQSMDATDLKPSRLQRARLKLLDLLQARHGGQTALIVYAADAFTVTPLTDDGNTIANLVPSLETALMPSQGSHAYRAVDKAVALLKQAGVTRGDLLLITDGISERDIEAIRALPAQGHRLSILGIGTADGSPIPLDGGFLLDANGAIVIPKLQAEDLHRAALAGGGLYQNLQADDSDIERLNSLFSESKLKLALDQQRLGDTGLVADLWREDGPWLLLLVIPFAVLWARKGWLLCLPLFMLPVTEPVHALELEQLWRNPDQRAMRAFNNGDMARAAESFEQAEWKASAYYRAGDYESSLQALASPVRSDDYYNRGNALAKLGRYPEAIAAYDEAIRLNPDNADAVYNREQVQRAMQQNASPQQGEHSEQAQNSQNQDSPDQQNRDQQNQDQQAGDDASQQQQDQQAAAEQHQQGQQQGEQQQEQPGSDRQLQDSSAEHRPEAEQKDIEQALKDAQQSEQETGEQETEHSDAQEQQQQAMAMNQPQAVNEQDQATEQWLKRIPDDPGMLLRRKFHYQYKRLPQQTPSEQQW